MGFIFWAKSDFTWEGGGTTSGEAQKNQETDNVSYRANVQLSLKITKPQEISVYDFRSMTDRQIDKTMYRLDVLCNSI